MHVHHLIARAVAFGILAIVPATLSAQDPVKPRADSTMKMGTMDDHMMGPWKEMNAFHRVIIATWHPASQKGDLTPLRTGARDLVTAADAWAAAKPPAMPASCGSEAVRNAVSRVATQSRALAALLASGAADDTLKAALKAVHDAFEVAEKGCAGHGEHGGTA